MSSETTDDVQRLPGGSWRVAGTRVSLESVVHAYWQGDPPEMIATNFPSLAPEQVYGAITFYRRHRDEIDRYLADQDAQWERVRQASEARTALCSSGCDTCAGRPRAGVEPPDRQP